MAWDIKKAKEYLITTQRELILTEIETQELIEKGDFKEKNIDPRNIWGGGNNSKIKRIFKECNTGEKLFPPIVFFVKNRVMIENGVHRIMIAYHMNIKSIMILKGETK